MLVIVIATTKGGSGKSTLTTQLAVEVERAGDGPVFIADADEQGSAAHWHNLRKGEGSPYFLDTSKVGLKQALENVGRAGARVTIIDTPGNNAAGLESIIALANFVIIPVQPSPVDLAPTSGTATMVKRIGRAFVFVLNKANPRAVLTGDTSRYLSDYGPVSRVVIDDRQLYKSSMINGSTAPELSPKGPAATEIAALWADVLARAKRGQQQEGSRHGKTTKA